MYIFFFIDPDNIVLNQKRRASVLTDASTIQVEAAGGVNSSLI